MDFDRQSGSRMLKDERYEALRKEISERLSAVCAHMPAANFDEMVVDIAKNARQSELRSHSWVIAD